MTIGRKSNGRRKLAEKKKRPIGQKVGANVWPKKIHRAQKIGLRQMKMSHFNNFVVLFHRNHIFRALSVLENCVFH